MRSRVFRIVVVCALLCGGDALGAEGWEKAFRFSSFDDVDIASLKRGKIETNRTPVRLPVAMAVETVFYIPSSPTKVAKGILSWNPTPHKVLGVLEHHAFKNPVSARDFSSFILHPEQREEEWLIRQSAKIMAGKTALNASRGEISRLARAGDDAVACSAVWRGILKSRATAYQKGGTAALGSYHKKEGVFVLDREIHRFLSRLPKVQSHFRPLLQKTWRGTAIKEVAENQSEPPVETIPHSDLSQTDSSWKKLLEANSVWDMEMVKSSASSPQNYSLEEENRTLLLRSTGIEPPFQKLVKVSWDASVEDLPHPIPKPQQQKKAAPKKSKEPLTAYYWEKIKINNEVALVLGTVKARRHGNCWQVADFQYYVSSNYFTSLILYQICPVNGGSVIWRGDYVLTPTILHLRGVERMFSQNILIQEVKKAIGFLKKDLS